MLLLAVLVGTIVMASDYFWQLLRVSGGRGRSGKDGNGGGGAIVVVVLVVAVLLALVSPLLAQMVQFAVSRQREYLADATAVELTRNPLGLANALRKIGADKAVLKNANRGTAHLFIANPIEKFQKMARSAFASHPPMEDRIARLEALARVGK
jgi:heat shock protein HtpX